MPVIGVILSGGFGLRFGGGIPKQYTKLAGRRVIEHTIDIFQKSENIDQIIVVCQKDYASMVWSLAHQNQWSKLDKVVDAGEDRMASTHSAIMAMSDCPPETKVLFHDAVRPFVTDIIIERCCLALDDFEAADVVIPSADTIVSVRDNGSIAEIPDRNAMRRGQTPQAFRLSTIKKAYAKVQKSTHRNYTCDCSVVRAMLPNTEVATVQGSETNIKITSPIDIFLAEKLMQSRGTRIADDDTNIDLSGKRIVVFGGNSGIGKAIHDKALIQGADVIVASRSTNNVDVTNLDCVEGFLAKVARDHGSIDTVINPAGILIRKPMSQMTPGEIEKLIATNYVGTVNVAIASRKYLIETRGALVNFTSSSYTRGRANYAIYSSTKCAIVNFTQALAEEWEDDFIRVNCINPERTKTPMRTSNFGIEDPDTLLDADVVARVSLRSAFNKETGLVVDVRKSSVDIEGPY